MESEIKAGVWMRLTDECRPDKGQTVLIEGSNGEAALATFTGKRFVYDDGEYDWIWEEKDVSHWLRIPPIPTEGDDGK